MSTMKWLRTLGPAIVTEDGSAVRLRGVGGWLNMENFITGYPATDVMHDVLEPVMARFTREFPGYDPYPFGARRYVEQLVLSICFAEPLVDEFATCFADASDDELVALGACFAFSDCVENEELCEVVSKSAHAVPE